MKTSIAAAMLLLALGVAACGGDDSDTTAADATSQNQSSAASDEDAAKSKKGKSGSGDGENNKSGSKGGKGEESAGDFVPKQHDDSGGGSEQFRVKGGDNSVQEFGEEADADEFSAAARAVHNFFDARAERHWAAACEYLADDVAESLEKLISRSKQVEAKSCAEILGTLTPPQEASGGGLLRKEARRADIGSLRVEGDRAFVVYRGLENTIMAIPVRMEDGEWKVASLAGTPIS